MIAYQNERAVCEATLKRAGTLAHERYTARDFHTSSKGAQDFVSEVDLATEALIQRALLNAFPDHTVLGEETGGTLGEQTWIIDPIDGTSNFVRGMHYWCLSAALVVQGEAVVGVIYDPVADEMFSCQRGAGATMNGTPISVSKGRAPNTATLGISFNFQNSKNDVAQVIAALLANDTSFRMMGAGALSLAHCAAGRTDGFWEGFMKPWDAAAGLLLIKEAGGVVCDYGARGGYQSGSPALGCTPDLAEYFSDLTGIVLAKALS